MASYRSMLSATSTYVDAYVTQTWTKRIALQAALPARHTTVMRQMMSVSTFSSPTQRSGYREGGWRGENKASLLNNSYNAVHLNV